MSSFGLYHFPIHPVLALAVWLGIATTGRAAVNLPNGGTVDDVDFERHVMGVFGKMGCNAGSCHGSFQGKGGFRLSLFGYEPARDFYALTREMQGRRLDRMNPDQSLLLLKATGQLPHGGGVRFSQESWQYQLIREWIRHGTPWRKASGDVFKLIITPPEQAFRKVNETIQLKVTAEFKGGTTADVTSFCDFRTNDDAVAEVSREGLVKSLRPGFTAIVVSYRGNVLPLRVLVPVEQPKGFNYPKVAEMNYIDRIVLARLKKLNIVPSDLAGDAEFLRRVYLDTIGTLPSPAEVRAFLKDSDPDKRSKKIDELLAHPLHAALWATKFSDITGNDTQSLEQPVVLKFKRSQMWHDWLRKRFQENMPYDELVKGILTATTREGKTPTEWVKGESVLMSKALESFDFATYADRPTLDLYWRRQQRVTPEQWGEKTAAAFLGVRLECAQCHKHPFDRWSQVQYRAYANLFTQVSVGVSAEAKNEITNYNNEMKKKVKKGQQAPQLREVFLTRVLAKGLPNPDTGSFLPAQALGGPRITIQPGEDAREKLFEWMRSRDNPFFARALVNRIWGHYLGVGIVDPVDDFSQANPASNPELLEALAEDFLDHNFDFRYMERVILNSRIYQLSSKTNASNKLDKRNYAHAYVRPLMAEVVIDTLNAALGVAEVFGKEVRPNSKAIEVGPSQLQSPQLMYAFRIFGRPPRTTACDCERALEPALPQKLYLMTDVGVLQKLRSPQGRLQLLLRQKMTDDEVLDELFLATLTRLPTERDRQLFNDHRQQATNRRSAFEDTLWALLNTREFILNH
jgi:hypothetical protein